MIGLRPLKIKTILSHAFFWIAVWCFYIYYFSYNSTDWSYILWFSGGLVPVTIIVTYTMVYYIIPNYLLEKKYLKFALYFFYTAVFTAHSIVIIIYACMIIIFEFKFGFDVGNIPPMSKNFSFVFILIYLIVGIVSLVHVLRLNFDTISKNKELQNKVLAAKLDLKDQELMYLKKQIHPHFLFNTLNTIYGFALKKSNQTPDIILKLSNLLDYILYQVNKPKVSVKEEAMHIHEYIELEKIRFRDTLRVRFESSKIDEDMWIAPMLMIPFVENAFKHGSIQDGFLQVEITISTHENQLHFVVNNTFMEDDEDKEQNNGIGLANIRKRLELHYAGNYELNIHKTENLYSSELSIFNLNLKDNG